MPIERHVGVQDNRQFNSDSCRRRFTNMQFFVKKAVMLVLNSELGLQNTSTEISPIFLTSEGSRLTKE